MLNLIDAGASPPWVMGGCGRQADGTAGTPPAPEIPVRSGTYALCQRQKFGLFKKGYGKL
jgi:hypothetical protein